MGHKLRKLDKEAVITILMIFKNCLVSSLRIRITRSENEQLRVQDISENQIHHENTGNEISRLQTNHPYVNRVVGVRPIIEEEENTDEPNNLHEEENDVRKNVLCVVKDL